MRSASSAPEHAQHAVELAAGRLGVEMRAHRDRRQRRRAGPAGARTCRPPRRRSRVQPSASACALNQSRTCLSSSVSVSRLMPPFGVPPIAAVSMSWSHSRCGSMARFRIASACLAGASLRGGGPQLRRGALILRHARTSAPSACAPRASPNADHRGWRAPSPPCRPCLRPRSPRPVPASTIRPTTRVAMPASRLIRSAIGTL